MPLSGQASRRQYSLQLSVAADGTKPAYRHLQSQILLNKGAAKNQNQRDAEPVAGKH